MLALLPETCFFLKLKTFFIASSNNNVPFELDSCNANPKSFIGVNVRDENVIESSPSLDGQGNLQRLLCLLLPFSGTLLLALLSHFSPN